MPSLNLRNPLRRDPNRPTLKQRAATLKATAARLIRKPKPLPAAGSPEALAAFGAACRAVDQVMRDTRDDDVPPIVPGRSRVWTSETVQAVQVGNFSSLTAEEAAAARATPRARLEELLITTLRRELRMAEAVKASRIRELHALVYGEELDPVDEEEVPAAGEPVGADPHLVTMVAEWQDVRRKLNDAAVLDGPEADALGEEHSTRQMEIYLYPARTPLDLLAKVPALRDELEDAKRGSDGGQVTNSLPVTAWTGLLADIERIAGATAVPADDADLIAAGRAFDTATVRHREAWDALDAAEDRAMSRIPKRPEFAGEAVDRGTVLGLRTAADGIEDEAERSKAHARINELSATLAAWEGERDRALDDENMTGARAVADEASSAAVDIARQATALPARTLAGVWVKVRIAAFYGEAEPTASHEEGAPGEAALRSLYRDAPRLVLDAETADISIVPEA